MALGLGFILYDLVIWGLGVSGMHGVWYGLVLELVLDLGLNA